MEGREEARIERLEKELAAGREELDKMKKRLAEEIEKNGELERNADKVLKEYQQVIAAQRDKLIAAGAELKAYKKMARRAMR